MAKARAKIASRHYRGVQVVNNIGNTSYFSGHEEITESGARFESAPNPFRSRKAITTRYENHLEARNCSCALEVVDCGQSGGARVEAGLLELLENYLIPSFVALFNSRL